MRTSRIPLRRSGKSHPGGHLQCHRPLAPPGSTFDTGRICREPSHMTKADIVDTVYEKVGGFSKKEAIEIVETVFEIFKKTLEKGERLKISGFGNFVVRDKKERVGRNPQTGKEITISARRVLTFKPSVLLKKALNS